MAPFLMDMKKVPNCHPDRYEMSHNIPKKRDLSLSAVKGVEMTNRAFFHFLPKQQPFLNSLEWD